MFYVTVSEGDTAVSSLPIVATSDVEVVRAVGRLIASRLDEVLPEEWRGEAQDAQATRERPEAG